MTKDNDNFLSKIIFWHVAAIYFIGILIFFSESASPNNDSMTIVIITSLAYILNILPQIIPYFTVRILKTKKAKFTCLIIQIIVSALGLYAYYDATYIHLDSFIAIIYITIAIYVSGAFILSGIILKIIEFIILLKQKTSKNLMP